MTVHSFPSRLRRKLLLVGAVAAAACSSDLTMSSPLGPGEESESALNVLSVAANQPGPESLSVTFVATKGEGSEGRIYLTDGRGHRGKEYLRLTVEKNSLLARPDGTPFALGESVVITVRVTDPARILFSMEPAGLKFDPADPAELRIGYDVAGDDIDRNGRHDAQDDAVETHLAIWRQTSAGAPFVRLPSSVTRSQKQVITELPGFSRYAIAY